MTTPVDHPRSEARESAIAGAGAGFVSSIVTCPLDVVKTRLQVLPGSAKRSGIGEGSAAQGVTNIVRQIWRDDGFRGFYRGLGPTMIGYLPTWAIYFTVYNYGKGLFASHASTCAHLPGASGAETFSTHIASAMVAGAVSTTCTSPLWVVKTRTMLQTSSEPEHVRYRSTLDAIRKIYHQEGLRAFYKGLLPSLLGVVHVVVQFPMYEYFKSLAGTEQLSPSMILLCSGGSKMIASIATYPHEVLRTRLQMVQNAPRPGAEARHYTGFFQAIKVIARNEGFTGFYKGMGVNLVRTVPNSGLTLLTYEVIMRYFAEHPL